MSRSQQKRTCIQSECAVREELREQLDAKGVKIIILDAIIDQDSKDIKRLKKSKGDAIEKLEAKNKLMADVVEASKFLLKVKNHKDANGKDIWYKLSQPIAWRKLDEALKEIK